MSRLNKVARIIRKMQRIVEINKSCKNAIIFRRNIYAEHFFCSVALLIKSLFSATFSQFFLFCYFLLRSATFYLGVVRLNFLQFTTADLHGKIWTLCPPSPRPIFFIFMNFSGNFGRIIGWRPGVLAPSLGNHRSTPPT